MDKRAALIRKLRTAVALILVGLYVVGLIAMMTFSFQAGLILWVISTLGGIGLLYWIRTINKRNEEAAKAEAESPSDSRTPIVGADRLERED